MKHSSYDNVVFLLIFAVFVYSLFRVLYYSYTIFSDKNWIFISDSKKKELIFKDKDTLLTLVSDLTPLSSKIVIYSFDDDLYFLSKYYLYPRYTIEKNIKTFRCDLNTEEFDFLILHFNSNNIDYANACNFKTVIKQYSKNGVSGIIYKL